MNLRAVVFDLGGVILGSPLQALARFEASGGWPAGALNRGIAAAGATGAWARLERGEISLGEEFYGDLDRELTAQGLEVSSRVLIEQIEGAAEPRPRMLRAVERIRQEGLLTAALTNNWWGGRETTVDLAAYFDHVLESRRLGVRKPEPEIYRITCEALRLTPREIVFLDDIGRNLKPARQLGMTTIKVGDPDRALTELGELLGFSL